MLEFKSIAATRYVAAVLFRDEAGKFTRPAVAYTVARNRHEAMRMIVAAVPCDALIQGVEPVR